MQDRYDRIQTIITGSQSICRLVSEFGRQIVHVMPIDIGRITDDQVVAYMLQIVEKSGSNQPDASFQGVTIDIDRDHAQGVLRDVHRINYGIRKSDRHRDGDAPAAGAKVDGAADAGRIHPGLEAIQDDFG